MCNPKFTEMQDTSGANLGSGADVGASVAVTIDGEFVVDLWGGWGGSMIFNDWDRHVTITYMMNRMEPGIIGCPPSAALIAAAYRALASPTTRPPTQEHS